MPHTTHWDVNSVLDWLAVLSEWDHQSRMTQCENRQTCGPPHWGMDFVISDRLPTNKIGWALRSIPTDGTKSCRPPLVICPRELQNGRCFQQHYRPETFYENLPTPTV